jgi:NTE family protein
MDKEIFMKTAFIFSGGGSFGCIQVGMLLALMENNIIPDFVVGTSVGAINAACIAGNPTLAGAQQLKDIWLPLKRKDLFPFQLKNIILGLLGRQNYFIASRGIKSLLKKNIPYQSLEQAKIPVYVIATEVKSGEEVLISKGPAVDAVVASASIPGVFSPITVDEQSLLDGGIVNNTPISSALNLGAQSIWVLPTGYACALSEPPKSPLSMMMHAVSLLIQQRLLNDIIMHKEHDGLHVIPPLCPIKTSSLDFNHTANYIDTSYEQTLSWLESKQDLESVIKQLHFHKH